MHAEKKTSRPLWPLALLAAVLPLLTINASYWLAVYMEHLPACMTYISGCTSVSSTGRMAPESLLFRAGMIPTAIVLVLVWHRNSVFLEQSSQFESRIVSLRLLAIVAAASLMLYALTLGFTGDFYRSLRRTGINGFALCNYSAQLLFIVYYRRLRVPDTAGILRLLIAVCVALPVMAVFGEVVKAFGGPSHPVNNMLAWNAFVVLSVYFAAIAWLWRRHNFTVEYGLDAFQPSDREI